MGKYSHVIDKLPRFMGEEPKYQEKVEATKKAILNSPFPEGLSESVLEVAVNEVKTELKHIIDPVLQTFQEATGTKKWGSQYALIYKNLRAIKDEIESYESNVNLLLEAYGQLLDEQLEVEGASGVTLDNGYNVRVQKEPYVKIEDKEAFREWCLANGYEKEMQLHWQTANGIAKELLLEGEPEPSGTKLYSKPKIVVTKPRG
jgi:hypothetical protein